MCLGGGRGHALSAATTLHHKCGKKERWEIRGKISIGSCRQCCKLGSKVRECVECESVEDFLVLLWRGRLYNLIRRRRGGSVLLLKALLCTTP